jgi:hypothetical protein
MFANYTEAPNLDLFLCFFPAYMPVHSFANLPYMMLLLAQAHKAQEHFDGTGPNRLPFLSRAHNYRSGVGTVVPQYPLSYTMVYPLGSSVKQFFRGGRRCGLLDHRA